MDKYSTCCQHFAMEKFDNKYRKFLRNYTYQFKKVLLSFLKIA